MLLAWTTVATRADADRVAVDVIERRLAVCVQIDGPIVSHYRWAGQVERSEEFRLCLKHLPATAAALRARVLELHPYEVPEWVVVRAEEVGEKYLSWAEASSTK